MKNLKKIMALAMLMAVSINATASDFGSWLGAEADKKLGNFTLSLGAGFRTQNNMKNVDRWDASFGVSSNRSNFLNSQPDIHIYIPIASRKQRTITTNTCKAIPTEPRPL